MGTRLHRISYAGEEESDYFAIGSGSVFVNNFLEQFYSETRDMEYCIKLGYFCILYVQRYVNDKSVGVETGKMPDLQIILDNGQFGTYKFSDEKTVLDELNKKVDEFITLQNGLTF